MQALPGGSDGAIVFIHMNEAALKLHACFLGKALDTGPCQKGMATVFWQNFLLN